MDNYEIIDEIIRREGGDRYTDRPGDRGGPTKFGVTQKAWEEYRAHGRLDTGARAALPAHVRELTLEKAREFYWHEHVRPFAWIEDAELRELVIDCSVNHGRERATKWLQRAVSVLVDGYIGPETRAQTNIMPSVAYATMLQTRLKFYAQIASDQQPADPDLPNLRGWINRACEFIR